MMLFNCAHTHTHLTVSHTAETHHVVGGGGDKSVGVVTWGRMMADGTPMRRVIKLPMTMHTRNCGGKQAAR